jgi:hypothetical protein
MFIMGWISAVTLIFFFRFVFIFCFMLSSLVFFFSSFIFVFWFLFFCIALALRRHLKSPAQLGYRIADPKPSSVAPSVPQASPGRRAIGKGCCVLGLLVVVHHL